MNTTLALLLAANCFTADSGLQADSGPTNQTQAAPASTRDGSESISDAERISRLQRAMENDGKELETLKSRLEDPKSDYHQIQAEFQKLDVCKEEAARELDKVRQSGDKEKLHKLEKEFGDLKEKWKLAHDRANLAIKERKTLEQKITALTEKREQDQKTLDRLQGKTSPETTKTEAPKAKDDSESASEPNATQAPATDNKQPATPSPKTENASNQVPQIPSIGKLITNKDGKESKELREAKQLVQVKEKAANKAKEKAQSITERAVILRKNIEVEQNLLQTAREKLDHIQKTIAAFEADKRKLVAQGNKQQEVDRIWQQLDEEWALSEKARQEVRRITNRLTSLQSELATVQAEQIEALKEATKKKREVEAARQMVAELQNPFTLKNMLGWLSHYGPRILVLLSCMFLLHMTARVVTRRVLTVMVRGSKRKTREREAEQRAQTLFGMVRGFSSLVIWGGGLLVLLDAIDIPVGALMGGAAVIGLAVAFGTQNLIRDYFTGFMILIEDQYGVRDVVRIGSTTGEVERISLRMTVLRDLEGSVHFIPHGTITDVTNLTHGWSRALFDVGVAYGESVDQVMSVIEEVGEELRKDPAFSSIVLDKLEMLGLDQLADSAVVIKFFIKTRPLKQWRVKREMLRRLKNRFDQLGIEIPFPHRTVYHRTVENIPQDKPSSHAA